MGEAFAPLEVLQHGVQGDVLLPSADIQKRIDLRSCSHHVLQDPVTDVCFSPREPYELAAASGFSVSIIDAQTDQVRRSLGRFRDIAYSPHFKKDGRLLVAGSADGSAKVFDLASRSVLRDFKGHKGPVRTAKFGSDGLRVMTGSDDTTVKVWDLPTAKCLFGLTEAKDYVRAQNMSPASQHVWLVGSADGKARLYDLRYQKCLFTLDHQFQIDDVHVLPGGTRAVTIGGPEVKVWDFFSGGKLVERLGSHAKAVTCGAVNQSSRTFATAGLDGHVKLHDLSSFETRGVLSFDSQILSLDVSQDGKRYGIGMADGSVDIRAKEGYDKGIGPVGPAGGLREREFEGWGRGFERLNERKGPRPGSRRYFDRAGDGATDDRDVIVSRFGKNQLKDYDLCFKKFAYGEALDRAVETKQPSVVVSVAEELILRGGLLGALAGRTLGDLCPLLNVIRNNMRNPTYTPRLTHILNVILDMYGNDFGKDVNADKLLNAILQGVSRELEIGREMIAMQGAVEAILFSSQGAS